MLDRFPLKSRFDIPVSNLPFGIKPAYDEACFRAAVVHPWPVSYPGYLCSAILRRGGAARKRYPRVLQAPPRTMFVSVIQKEIYKGFLPKRPVKGLSTNLQQAFNQPA